MTSTKIEELCVNTIRFLSIDAVQKANSGHPGAPMGAATMAYVLWDKFLKHNPADPNWPDRDRFVLSAGHASMLLYSLLHLTGYDLSLKEIKQFRQWGSKTPGHPEYGLVPGVEATTGPLGQGFANGIGMAIAERWLATHYNLPDHEIIGHHVYSIVSDGDLEEGVASESASLAGNLGLGKIIYLYDDNGISIEGSTGITFTDNVKGRFESYGWQVIGPINGMASSEVEQALREAKDDTLRPSLIICKTTIGYGSPNKAGSASTHGSALGEEEVQLTKENLGWTYEESFTIPDSVTAHMRKALLRGSEEQANWETLLESYRVANPEKAKELEGSLKGDLPKEWDSGLDGLFSTLEKPTATRIASGEVMNRISEKVHFFIGGSADLAPSTSTILKDRGDFASSNYGGHNLHFGVREHAMGAVSTGMALHGGVIPYTATFLIFSDYMRPPIRLAALMKKRVIFIFTHDSVGLGEDGPTHQPIEQLIGLRSVPNLVVIRPADANETTEAWKVALTRSDGPTAIILTRQNLPLLDQSLVSPATGLQRGGYVLWEASARPEVLLIATGSEVNIALDAGQSLIKDGISSRVVSLPSWELFEAQDTHYRERIIPPTLKARISIEAAATIGWERYIGLDGKAIGLQTYGVSAPGNVIYEQLGLTTQRIVGEAKILLRSNTER
jgi:transketolase